MGSAHYRYIEAYSKDLRKRIVQEELGMRTLSKSPSPSARPSHLSSATRSWHAKRITAYEEGSSKTLEVRRARKAAIGGDRQERPSATLFARRGGALTREALMEAMAPSAGRCYGEGGWVLRALRLPYTGPTTMAGALCIAIIDSWTAKSTEKGGIRGDDGGKNISGRTQQSLWTALAW